MTPTVRIAVANLRVVDAIFEAARTGRSVDTRTAGGAAS